MADTHTHGPGDAPHSHGPPAQQQPQQMAPPPPKPDPLMQAIIEADFKPVDIALGSDESQALCPKHAQEKCTECGVDYLALNRLAKLLVHNPTLKCPPPPNVVSQKLSQAINTTKEEGNALYKQGKHRDALSRYTMAANFALQRPPWEANQFMREELSTVISNRSAALFELGDFVGALVDAEAVISLKRPWSKGHFRKAKALIAMNKEQEAMDALSLGLQYEPTNIELKNLLTSVEEHRSKMTSPVPAVSSTLTNNPI